MLANVAPLIAEVISLNTSPSSHACISKYVYPLIVVTNHYLNIFDSLLVSIVCFTVYYSI